MCLDRSVEERIKMDVIRACQGTFEKLKLAVSSKPMLCLPNFDLPYEVHMDASDKALSGDLVQEEHSMVFESRKFKDPEQ